MKITCELLTAIEEDNLSRPTKLAVTHLGRSWL